MLCPFTLKNPVHIDNSCRRDCALRVIVKRKGTVIGDACAFAVMASTETEGTSTTGVLVETKGDMR